MLALLPWLAGKFGGAFGAARLDADSGFMAGAGEWWDPCDRERWAHSKRMLRAPHPEEGEQPDADQGNFAVLCTNACRPAMLASMQSTAVPGHVHAHISLPHIPQLLTYTVGSHGHLCNWCFCHVLS